MNDKKNNIITLKLYHNIREKNNIIIFKLYHNIREKNALAFAWFLPKIRQQLTDKFSSFWDVNSFAHIFKIISKSSSVRLIVSLYSQQARTATANDEKEREREKKTVVQKLGHSIWNSCWNISALENKRKNIRSHFTKYSWGNFANCLSEPGTSVHLTNEQRSTRTCRKMAANNKKYTRAPGNFCWQCQSPKLEITAEIIPALNYFPGIFTRSIRHDVDRYGEFISTKNESTLFSLSTSYHRWPTTRVNKRLRVNSWDA